MSEKEEILTKDNSVTKILNNFFSNNVKTLGISDSMHSHPLAKEVNDSTLKAIMKCRNYLNVLTILDKYKNNSIFNFSRVTRVTREKVLKEIGHLGITKSSQDIDIPTKIIKENSDIFACFICKTFNNVADSSTFPAALKLAHITPAFKKGSKNSKENYRLISILPNISKVYERCMYK